MNTNARVTTARTNPLLLARWIALGVLALGAAVALRPAAAQNASTLELATAEELYDIVGPIALYPDDLVAVVLPASTYPLQVVQAARFIEDRKRDSTLTPNDEWDDSIVALLNYPEVVEMLNDDLDWTYDLGTAVLNQRADVLNAIQDFRDEAYAAGNLRSDDRQTVARNDGAIAITPADPEVIYVPYYEPARVVVYQPAPVYFYYPRRYPVYYYPYPAHYVFDTGFFWGVRSWFSIGWSSHLVHVYDWHYNRHPYYGWNYYDPFYVRNVYVNINVNRNRGYVWEPRNRYGGRPVVRGYEGRVYTADRAPRNRTRDGSAATSVSREGSAYRQGGTAARTVDRAAPPRSAATASSRTAPQSSSRTAPQSSSRAAPQSSRSAPSSTYRTRSADTAQRGAAASQNGRATRTIPSERVAGAPARETAAYRNGSGTAPDRSRAVAQPNRETRASGSAVRVAPNVSPRNVERSTGMPREASRASEARPSAPTARAQAPSSGAERGSSGGNARSGGSGSYRADNGGGGRSNSGGGSYRSGNGGGQRGNARSSGNGAGR